MSVEKLLYLQHMGIEPCVLSSSVQDLQQAVLPSEDQVKVPIPTKSDIGQAAAQPSQADDSPTTPQWQSVELEVMNCKKCILHQTRTQTVFGVGDKKAQWMFIGEAPGLDEDRKGEPFVGRAGQLLTKMLKAIGFERNEVYIANVIKCRPPDNRNPRLEEIVQCLSYLHRQIQLVQPEIIVLLGGVAANALLKEQTPVSRLRGQIHRIENTQASVIVTYHPAYLLRSPNQKAAAWEDLQFACKTVGREL